MNNVTIFIVCVVEVFLNTAKAEKIHRTRLSI